MRTWRIKGLILGSQCLFNQSGSYSDEANMILCLPLPRFEMADSLLWQFSSNVIYSVKSGYKVALSLQRNGLLGSKSRGESSSSDHMEEVWKSVWNLPCQGKIKQFMWKCMHDIAPVN